MQYTTVERSSRIQVEPSIWRSEWKVDTEKEDTGTFISVPRAKEKAARHYAR